jgi:hypothetical protein
MISVARLQTRTHELLPEKVATKTTLTRPFSASLGIYTLPLHPRLQVPQPHVRYQPVLQTSPLSWRPSFLAPPTALLSVYAKLAQWYPTRLTAHLNQHTRTACSQHHGQLSPWSRLSKQELEMVIPRHSRLHWVLKPQDTTLHRHLVLAVRKPTTSCPAFASRPYLHGVSQASMALSPITREASHLERLPRPQASRCGRTTRTRPPRVAPSRHRIRNDARRHKCLVTLDLVAID